MTPEPTSAERAFRAMGSEAHVLVWSTWPPGGPTAEELLDGAEALVERLESRWSRFRPDSDISRLNAADGEPVAIAAETGDLLERCRWAAAATAGRFEPMVLPALLDAGYDRSFELLVQGGAGPEPPGASPAAVASVLEDLQLDPLGGTARLRRGTAIDVGGIGKGRAADLVAGWLVEQGAVAACANLGGDLRVVGEVPGGLGLVVGIEDPFGGPDLGCWSVRDAGVATSSQLRRRWTRHGEDVHHLIDPRTGRPTATDVVAATVVAPSGELADVLAKTVLLAPAPEVRRLLGAAGAAALVLHAGGRVSSIGEPPSISVVGGGEDEREGVPSGPAWYAPWDSNPEPAD